MTEDVQVTPPAANGQEPHAQQNDQPDVFDRAYVEKLRQEAASYRTRAKELEEARQREEEQRLVDQKKWQELAEKRKRELEEALGYKERLNGMLATLAERNAARIEQVPEDMRNLIPEYDDPAKLAQWLDTSWAFLTSAKPAAPSLNGGAGTSAPRVNSVALTDDELKVAAAMGIKPEDYAKWKVKK